MIISLQQPIPIIKTNQSNIKVTVQYLNLQLKTLNASNQGWQYCTVRSEFAYCVPRILNCTVPAYRTLVQFLKRTVPANIGLARGGRWPAPPPPPPITLQPMENLLPKQLEVVSSRFKFGF